MRNAGLPSLPLWIQREWLFWACMLLWCIVPSTKTPWWHVGGVPVKSIDLAVPAMCALMTIGSILPSQRVSLCRGWHWYLPHMWILLCGWALVSFAWSGITEHQQSCMIWTLISAASVAVFGWGIAVTRDSDEMEALLWRMTLFLTFVAALYSAESLFSLGLRSAAAPTSDDFGLERVRGPLFESSTGYYVLLPPLGFALQRTLKRAVPLLTGICVVLCLIIAIIGLGSRAGLLLIAVFVLLATLTLRDRNRLVAGAVLVCSLTAGAYMVFRTAKTDRLSNVSAEDGRRVMHTTIRSILSARTLPELLAGSGYGSVWPWYETESWVEGGDLYSTGRYTRITEHGLLIYHSHSTALVLIVELGIAGAAALLWQFRALATAVMRSAAPGWQIFACSLAVSAAALFFDLFIFRRPTRDLMWSVYFFGLANLLNFRAASCKPTPMSARMEVTRCA